MRKEEKIITQSSGTIAIFCIATGFFLKIKKIIEWKKTNMATLIVIITTTCLIIVFIFLKTRKKQKR